MYSGNRDYPSSERARPGAQMTPSDVAQPAQPARPATRTRLTRSQAFGWIATLAAVALLLAGFIWALPQRITIAVYETPFATGKPPAWREVHLPLDSASAPMAITLTIAPSDGRRMYACAINPSDGNFQVWATQDVGAHWRRMADVPDSGNNSGQCNLEVDANTPMRLVVSFFGGFDPTAPQGRSTIFVSGDGAQSWRLFSQVAVPQNYGILNQLSNLATDGANVYALHDHHLAAGDANLAHWRILDAAITGQGSVVDGFWLNPYNGALVAVARSQPTATTLPLTLWATSDSGATWRNITPPSLRDTSGALQATFTVARATDATHWRICGGGYTSQAKSVFANSLLCSEDGGATWSGWPPLDIPQCDRSAPCTAAEDHSQADRITLLDDGSLLAQTLYSPTVNGLTQPVREAGMFRLALHGGAWEYLGQSPKGPSLIYSGNYDFGDTGGFTIYGSGGGAPGVASGRFFIASNS